MLARTTAAADGTYAAGWRTSRLGAHRVRAVLDRDGGAAAATTAPELGITVHRPAMATWYGPGFYGRRTACGQRMSRTLQGVAHKTLPCGTKVSLLYRGRRLTVPVVDRGPYAAGKYWDLTSATATALRFTHTDRVGAVAASGSVQVADDPVGQRGEARGRRLDGERPVLRAAPRAGPPPRAPSGAPATSRRARPAARSRARASTPPRSSARDRRRSRSRCDSGVSHASRHAA